MSMDLRSTWLGLSLDNPLVPSASPLTGNLPSLLQLEDAGASAAVLPSLFEEQIEHEQLESARMSTYATESFAEALDYFPALEDYNHGSDRYLGLIREAKERTGMHIVASLNGHTRGGWISIAADLAQAGADAIELNVAYFPTDPELKAEEVEDHVVRLVEGIHQAVALPVAVKLGPAYTNLAQFAPRLIAAGAQGLVLFNRFLEPVLDLETMKLEPHLQLSHPAESGRVLRWIGILRGQDIGAGLAATSGIHTAETAIGMFLVGADIAQLASVLLQRGPAYLGQMCRELADWLQEKEYTSLEQARGSMSLAHCPDPEAYRRGNYMKALTSYSGPHAEA